ncbi:MAG: type IV pilus secretin PilQ [Desulfobacteraceae bacterium]|nr:MAG: type IV pilus secretin PilQ [Desulfobacteraceae bacterium]
MSALNNTLRGFWSKTVVPVFFALAFLSGCAAIEQGKAPPEKDELPVIEAVSIRAGAAGSTELEILTNREAAYTSFATPDKKRLFIDIRAVKGPALKEMPGSSGTNIASVSMVEAPGETNLVRLELQPAAGVNSSVVQKGQRILAVFQPSPEAAAGRTKEEPPARLLDVYLSVLEKGTSRLTFNTDTKVRYGVERAGERTILLNLENTGISPALAGKLKESRFDPPVETITPDFSEARSNLGLSITLKEIVPYHLTQREGSIHMDFARMPGRIKESKPASAMNVSKQINSPKQEQMPVKQAPAPKKEASPSSQGGEALMPGLQKERYTGQRMTMDFVNADVTNILRLIGEVSNLNIVWGPDVKGIVSMRLKNVPWDQALDLVLANNDLAMRRQGNVIWVTTRTRLAQVEEEEKRKREEELAQRAKQLKEAEEAKKSEPLLTEYLTLDFAKATEIKDHIEKVKSERGTVSVDERTNTIIVKDTQQVIDEAKKIAERFDAPVKQIMIEARIVDASTNFSRDLGVKWGSVDGTTPGIDRRWRKHETQGWGTDATQYNTYGDMIVGGNFSSNTPTDWVSNIGLSFARLTNRGLGILALDASLALAETENKVKIISAPKVMASNGEKAVISRGDIIYKEIVTADQRDVKELEATLSLTVTPTVSFNDYVTMEVEVTDDKANPDLSGKTEKTIKTKLMVKSGDTLVIGGIYKEDKSETESGIPWLRDIPVLGWAFKAEKTGLGKTELLVFLTPRVVPPAAARK